MHNKSNIPNTELDYSANNMSIKLAGWKKGGTIYKVNDKGDRTLVEKVSSLEGITLTPGKYVVVNN
jgi:hypothetical protein